MVFQKISIHKIDLPSRKNLFKEKFKGEENKKVFEFLRLLSIGELNGGKPIGEVRQRKYLDMLTIFFRNIKKPVLKLSKEDIRKFKEDLIKNKIKQLNKSPYSDRTKQDVTETIIKYLEWRNGKKAILWKLREWFIIRSQKKTPEYLKEEEAESLYKSCKDNASRFLIAVLFDSGARIEEFLNIRFEDIQEPTQSFPYYKIEIKQEYSKTDGRTIGMYWKYSSDAIREYLAEKDRSDLKAPVFEKTYDAVTMFLRRLGKRVLKKRVYAHLFRKSSATFYASKLNRQQLCVRYGWKFSSDMPDVYIKRAGIDEEDVKKAMVLSDISKLDKENQELKQKIAIVSDDSEKIRKVFEEMVERIEKLESMGRRKQIARAIRTR